MKNHYPLHSSRKRSLAPARGFTLIELMVTVIIIGILSAIAIPNYSRYVQRSRIADAVTALSQYRLRMEQVSQDNGNYGVAACAVAVPAETDFFKTECAIVAGGAAFAATATGKGSMAGYVFSIDNLGNKKTTQYAGSNVASSCWMTSPGGC